MKIIVKLMNLQYTTEVGDVSINYANGDVVISEITALKADRSEEPVHVEQPKSSCEPSIKVEHDSKKPRHKLRRACRVVTFAAAASAIKLLGLGYSIISIARHLGINENNISSINNGRHPYCKEFTDITFPIQHNTTGKSLCGVWGRAPVTLCKECGEPISVAALQCNPTQCYCEKCAEKHIPNGTLKNDEYTDITEPITKDRINPKTAAGAIKLLELGYSIISIARHLGISRTTISKINSGEHPYCKGFSSKKFPIQHTTNGGDNYAWRIIPVTLCKECGKPIPLAELMKDPQCEYCPDCSAKHKEE